MSGKFKLLVFDWDGTLMDSEARIINSMRCAITEIGVSPRHDSQLRNIIGLSLSKAVQTLYPDADSATLEGLIETYRRFFLNVDQTPSDLFRGVRDVLPRLKMQGYLLAVATGKARVGLEKVFNVTGVGDIFDASRCADETLSKPHPQMLREIMAVLGVTARETLMIGDTEYDMQMSRNAGTHALAVSYGVHDLPRLLKQCPLGHIDDIRELPTWLEKYTSNGHKLDCVDEQRAPTIKPEGES
jgi:phosphoglycolate phosphatase